MTVRGGFEVDIEWKGGALSRAVIRSILGQPCKVRYGDQVADLKIGAGGSCTLDRSLSPGG